MIIQDVASFIAANTTSVVGENLFISELPSDVNDCIALVYSPSPDPNKAIPYYTQNIDIRARFIHYEDGYAKLKEIMDLLHSRENYELGDFHVYLSYAVGMIMDNDRDSERRHLLQLTLGFVYRAD